MHDLTFLDVKFHAPFIRPFTQVVQGLLEPLFVLVCAHGLAQLGIIRELGTLVVQGTVTGTIYIVFVTILTDRSMQDVTVERSRVIFAAIAISRKIVHYNVTVYIG